MKDLREFIDKVEKLGELRVIEDAHWEQEIGAITYFMAAQPSPPAILFDKVDGYEPGYRVLTMPCETDKRRALMLGLPLEASRLELVRKLRDKLSEPLELMPPVEVKKGPIMENVHTGDEVDLFEFPTPHWFARDGGRYIGTGDNVIIKDPDEGWVNVSVQRVQIHDKSTATIFFDTGRHGDIIRRKYWAKGQSCPVAVTCGGDPLHVFAGGFAAPWGMPEYDYVGWWRKEPVEVIKGPTTGLPIPAYAEIALEGEMVPPEVETRTEGPFSEWTGHYSPARPEPAFRVQCVLHRNDPIILGVLPFLGRGVRHWVTTLWKAAQLWKELDRTIPGIKGVWSPQEFGPNAATVISLKQLYPGHAKRAALAALGIMGYYMSRYIIVVDDDIDPSNLSEVLFATGLRAEPEEFDIIRGYHGAILDPRVSPQKREIGDFTISSVIILACKPYYWIRDFPASVKPSPEVEERVIQKWGKLVL